MTDRASSRRLGPPGTQSPEEIAAFVKKRAYQSSPLYAGDYSRFRKAELYDQSTQWIQRAAGYADAPHASQWQEITQTSDPNSLPTPVYNEGVGLRENESARLGRPEYKPRVRARGENPSITAREGAAGAERALRSRLKDMAWDQQADLLYLHLPLYGGAWIESSWDQTWMDVVRIPAPSLACPNRTAPPRTTEPSQSGPGQDETPADPTAPAFSGQPGQAPQGPGSGSCDYVVKAAGLPAGDHVCPHCQLPLQQYQPTLEEAQGDLGMDVPKGDWVLRILTPYGVFPRDAGVGLDRTDIDEWVRVHVETVDWVAERYPDKVHDARTGEPIIKGDNPVTLMAKDATFGAPQILSQASNASVCQDSVLVYEYNRKPWFEWDAKSKQHRRNHGRHVVLVAQSGGRDVVCLDSTLLVQNLNKPGSFVARKRLEFVPWELRDGGRRATVGQSLWDRLFDPQDGVNERKSQVRATNSRIAVPFYVAKRGANLREATGADLALPGRLLEVDVDPGDNRPLLQLANNETANSGLYAEISDDREAMPRISGSVEVEKGQVPAGVSAATAIAYLKTEAGERRRPRILRVRQALGRAWEHGLSLMGALYIEPRPYSYEDETGEERWAFIKGDVIASANPKVDIYPTPDFDVTDARRESVRDLVQLGLLDLSQPDNRRRAIKAIDPTLDFFADDDQQAGQAQREWQRFKDEQRVPVVDPSLDDADAHYQEHGRACFTPYYRQREEQGGWDQALQVLGSQWDESLQMLAAQLPPGTSPQVAILQMWAGQLQQAGLPLESPALLFCLQWRAHMEAHRLALLIQQIKQQQQQAQVAAPGAEQAPQAPAQAQPMPPQPQEVPVA